MLPLWKSWRKCVEWRINIFLNVSNGLNNWKDTFVSYHNNNQNHCSKWCYYLQLSSDVVWVCDKKRVGFLHQNVWKWNKENTDIKVKIGWVSSTNIEGKYNTQNTKLCGWKGVGFLRQNIGKWKQKNPEIRKRSIKYAKVRRG